MKKRICSLFLSASLLIIMTPTSLVKAEIDSKISDDTNIFGTIKVTVIDEDTNETFSEDRRCFSIVGSTGLFLGNWNPAESNPVIINNAQLEFQYKILYKAKDYDGYTYYINTDKCNPLIDFADGTSKDVTIYMKKNYWAETTIPDNTISSEIKSFEELCNSDENELHEYCLEHGLNYIEKKEAEYQITNKCGIYIRVNPNNYLINAESDLLESDDLSSFKKNNFSDYDFKKMVDDLQFPKNYYIFNLAKSNFVFYSQSEPDENNKQEQIFLKLAQIYVQPNSSVSNGISLARLYQVASILAEQNPVVSSVSLERLGAISNCVSNNLQGDANCDKIVDMSDAVMIMQSLANPDKYQISEQGRKNADMNGDGVTNADALSIQKMLLKLD